jgi:hypothetical protein
VPQQMENTRRLLKQIPKLHEKLLREVAIPGLFEPPDPVWVRVTNQNYNFAVKDATKEQVERLKNLREWVLIGNVRKDPFL